MVCLASMGIWVSWVISVLKISPWNKRIHPLMLWTDIISHLNNIFMIYTLSSIFLILFPTSSSLSLHRSNRPPLYTPAYTYTHIADAHSQPSDRRLTSHRTSHRIQHEAVDTICHAQDQHGSTAIECIAGSHQVPAWLQRILLRRLISRVLGQRRK